MPTKPPIEPEIRLLTNSPDLLCGSAAHKQASQENGKSIERTVALGMSARTWKMQPK